MNYRNIVLRVTDLSDYRRILLPAMERLIAKGRKLVYLHFSEHKMVPDQSEDVEVISIPLNHRFEAFTVEVYRTIQAQEEGAILFFDSISELQTAWATDLMMENFFRVITPMVKQRSLHVIFPLIRGRHANGAIEEIRALTDVFLDIFSDFKCIYMRPWRMEETMEAKESKRTSPYDKNAYLFNEKVCDFEPIEDNMTLNRFHKIWAEQQSQVQNQSRDSWDRFFDETQKAYEEGREIGEECDRICRIMMSRDLRIRELIHKHYRPEDYFYVREHLIGTGLIGGKACGMLMARKIVENERPDIYEHMEPHDSYFIGSDVFYSYIVENDFWDLRVKQRTKEGYFAVADEFADRLKKGVFSKSMKKQFLKLLEYYGPSPVIVRSSSILEDGFGNAFAGKYDSVYCANCGTAEERLEEFEQAIRIVYASAMSRSALDYRLRRGLENRDEQMALLVQRVSGSHFGDYFFPCAAGVGYSYSTYRFLEELDPQAGMLRLVMGLGTAAVDRTEGSYPRLVSLDKPKATSFKSDGEHHRYSQQNIDVVNTKLGSMEQVRLTQLEKYLPNRIKRMVLDHDMDAERRFRDRGMRRDVLFVGCSGLVKNERLMSDMQGLMQAIDREYHQSVDIEYTINIEENGEYFINLLQCRPLQVFQDIGKQGIPKDLKAESIFIDCSHSSMGYSQKKKLDVIVYVDPIAYYNMPYNDKYHISRIIGHINWKLRGQGKHMLLLVPGRICTSSPELGVPTAFSDISEFQAIFEVSESSVGYNPELSYGSHIFQDLVENEILYMAVFEDERRKCFQTDFLKKMENKVTEYDVEAEDYKDIVGYYDVSEDECILYHDLLHERLVCTYEARQENRGQKGQEPEEQVKEKQGQEEQGQEKQGQEKQCQKGQGQEKQGQEKQRQEKQCQKEQVKEESQSVDTEKWVTEGKKDKAGEESCEGKDGEK